MTLFLDINWNAISALGTLSAVVVAALYTVLTNRLWKATLSSLQKQSESNERQRKVAEFEVYLRMAEKIDVWDAQLLLQACVADSFDIHDNIVNTKFLGEPVCISGITIRTYILVPFTDLANFWKLGLITIPTIKSGFGSLILSLGNSSTIVSHIKYLRKDESKSYLVLEELYKAIYETLEPDQKNKFKPDFS